MVQQWGILVIYLPFKSISVELRVFATNYSTVFLECHISTFGGLAFIKRMFLSSILLQDMTSCLISCLTYLRHVTQCFLQTANEVWGKVMFLHLCVILLTGVLASQHVSQVTWPVGGLPPGSGSASRGWADRPAPALRDTINKWAVRILLECILVSKILCNK